MKEGKCLDESGEEGVEESTEELPRMLDSTCRGASRHRLSACQ